MIKWVWKGFDEICANEMHEMLKLRQEVFILEQQCIYPDVDDLDKLALHLFGFAEDAESNTKPNIKPAISENVDKSKELVAYLRVFKPGIKFPELSFGRVLTHSQFRGLGLGKDLIAQALQMIDKEYPQVTIKISAQYYLEHFYKQFGFLTHSEPYTVDDIMHVDMLRYVP